MKYTNSFHPLSYFFTLIILGLLASQLSHAQPTGLYVVQEGDLVFKDSMETFIKPSLIELNAALSTKRNNATTATADHNNRMEQLTSLISSSGGKVIEADNLDLVKSSGILKIRSSERTAITSFKIQLSSDQQIAEVIDALFQTDGAEVNDYEVIFELPENDLTTSLTTDLTNKIIATIMAESKATGTQLAPKGLSQIDVESQDLGLDYMDSLVEGLELDVWKQSENEITLIQREVKIAVAVVAK